MKLLTGILLLFLAVQGTALGLSAAELNRLTDKYAKSPFPLFFDLLSLPKDTHFPADIEMNINWCELPFSERNFNTVSNQPTLSFGARGICEMTITTFGPRNPVHSGNYGNHTPNPAQHLVKLPASMKDDEGRVLIPGYYDGVGISAEERKILYRVPDDESSMKKFPGIAKPDAVGNNFQEAMQYPTLNIRGLNSLYVGKEARTLIPDKAIAEIDIRLVPSSDPDRLIKLVEEHIQKQGFTILKNEPTEEERLKYPKIAVVNTYISYAAFQTPFSSLPGVWLTKGMCHAFGKDPIRIRTAGGSIPIAPFIVTLNIPAVAVDVVNADNNQHTENENIRVGNYIEAIKTFLAILSQTLEK